MKSKSKHNEASALYHAEQIGREKERAVWEKRMAEMLAEKDAEIARISKKIQSNTIVKCR